MTRLLDRQNGATLYDGWEYQQSISLENKNNIVIFFYFKLIKINKNVYFIY